MFLRHRGVFDDIFRSQRRFCVEIRNDRKNSNQGIRKMHAYQFDNAQKLPRPLVQNRSRFSVRKRRPR